MKVNNGGIKERIVDFGIIGRTSRSFAGVFVFGPHAAAGKKKTMLLQHLHGGMIVMKPRVAESHRLGDFVFSTTLVDVCERCR